MNNVPTRRGRPPKTKVDLSQQALEKCLSDIRSMAEDRNVVMNRQVGGNHYANKTIQPWAAMQSWMSKEEFVGFLRGNALKYLARCNDKGGVEDIKKAQHYIDKLIEVLESA